jgi:hypothetical protein
VINFDEFIYQVDLKARVELPPTKDQKEFKEENNEKNI